MDTPSNFSAIFQRLTTLVTFCLLPMLSKRFHTGSALNRKNLLLRADSLLKELSLVEGDEKLAVLLHLKVNGYTFRGINSFSFLPPISLGVNS